MSWQKGILFAAGLAVGVAAGVAGVMSLRGGGPETPSMGAASSSSAAASAATSTASASLCQMAPMLGKSGDGDGQEALQARPKSASADEVAALILHGKEAAASKRQRDAEVAFLDACRNAAVIQGGGGGPLADAMYQLARHYTNAAAFGAPRSRDLYERADRLYSASLATYQARYGASHEKTRFAQEGLITVRQVTGGHAPGAPIAIVAPPQPGPEGQAKVQPLPASASAPTVAESPAAPARQQARRTAPSFDCARVRSATEKLICEDQDLARQDRERGRLHERARRAAAASAPVARETTPVARDAAPVARDAAPVARDAAPRQEPAPPAPAAETLGGAPATASGNPNAETGE